MSKKWTYSGTRAGYASMWASLTIKPGNDARNADRFARKIVAGEASYRAVQAVDGVPWYFVGALHMRESSCNFTTHLHNGDPLTARTRRVPAGYPKQGQPPFDWATSAVDALRLKGMQKYKGNWCPSLMGFVGEEYNGEGYINHGVNSPYLYAGSNHEQLGKYVRDHVWDATFDDPQIGVLTVLKRLCELRPDIAAEMVEPKSITPAVKKGAVVVGTGGATAGAVVATAPDSVPHDVATSSLDTLNQLMPFITFVQQYGETIALALGCALAVATVAYWLHEKWLD